ncbi:hypothetical protein TK78_23175 [Streptomyces sp. Tue 6075]|nr:hypothetical protein TK78_23175 [Streptomyces sp. Tue 6075]
MREAARRHLMLQERFKGARKVTDLPQTPNDSKRFDQLWRTNEGKLVIVEAKGPKADLDYRATLGWQPTTQLSTSEVDIECIQIYDQDADKLIELAVPGSAPQ